MHDSNSGQSSRMSSHSSVKERRALCRLGAVSKMRWKRTRNSYRVRSRGSLANKVSSFVFSSSDNSCGLRRNSHIKERNSLRCAFESFALYARVIFFPLAIDGLVEVLGD